MACSVTMMMYCICRRGLLAIGSQASENHQGFKGDAVERGVVGRGLDDGVADRISSPDGFSLADSSAEDSVGA